MVAPLEVDLGILGWSDSLILMVLALVVFGPRRLPQIGRQIGKLMYEFRKASNDFKFQMEEELRNAEEADRRKKEEERLRALAAQAPAPAPPTPALPAGSPYSEDAVYPPSSPPAEPATAQTEAPPDENYPRILPPSTGEPVPAARSAQSITDIDVDPEFASGNGAASQTSHSGTSTSHDVEHHPAPADSTDAPPAEEQAARHG